MNTKTVSSFVILHRAELAGVQTDEMFQLLAHHFEGVTRGQFDHDLAEKNWLVLIYRETRLVGFSTLLVYESSFEGEPVSVVCSGDTIVAPEAWGTTALSRGWITAVNQIRDHYSRGKYYWLLLTSGFRTYRFLPVFWREFYPRFDVQTPANIRELREHLARERFGEQYDAHAGIVKFHRPQRLRGELKIVPDERRADPHVAYFLAHNPGHADGDELVCLTELCPENLTAAGRRMSSLQTCEP